MKDFGISEDEIIRDWSLHDEDFVFVKKFRKQYQLWVYLQVCSLILLGQGSVAIWQDQLNCVF